ncbi:hypothetical protein [Pikeienuella sp. HZG-20]|uniref:hypothetical protein n=1 Tax=Paludibacillus litoralis TaxID=3133267 RepID=UPI0030ECB6B4
MEAPDLPLMDATAEGGTMSDDGGKDERSMSEILASIRKIVTDEEGARRQSERESAESAVDVLELTEKMRAGPEDRTGANGERHNGERHGEASNLAPLMLGADAMRRAGGFPGSGVGEMEVAEVEAIVRRVIREELKGPVGVEISRKVKAVIREEVRRALAENEPLI